MGDPGADTTHERATPRGEPHAWYERKVDTLEAVAHELAPRESSPTPDAL